DYKERFVHKEAGMEFTIIMGCLPDPATGGSAPPSAGEGDLVLRVRRLAGGRGAGAPPDPQGVVPVARFEVDGVVLGDERSWDEVRVDRVTGGSATVAELARLDAAEQIVCVIEPRLDRLVESVVTAPAGGAA
ncbi:MAG TPA: hypothetical protein VKW77_04440, partial [Acidimicrobiales bacterium]|nr:hypothetical protein [Acidimicrobiales bacterium]